MNSRQSQLLNSIIKEYIDTAEPVGSSFLVSKYGLGISPATVRNEMAVLEKEGYVRQPHTSAGRVPTEKGYKYFVETVIRKEAGLDNEAEKLLEQAARPVNTPSGMIKNLARAVAEITGETVVISFADHDFYYTGVANLCRKPEFKNYSATLNIAEVIDEFDEAMEQFFAPQPGPDSYAIEDLRQESRAPIISRVLDEVGIIGPRFRRDAQRPTSNPDCHRDASEFFNSVLDEPKVLIGIDNPFSKECATILTNIKIGEAQSVFGLLGPMRMNYENNLAIMKYIKDLLRTY